MRAEKLLSPAEVGAIAGIPLRSVYKAIQQRLPAGFVVRRNRQTMLTRWGAICVVIDYEMPKYVPLAVRKQVYAQIKSAAGTRAIKSQRGIFNYMIDVKYAADKMNVDLANYREAMQLIVADPDVQAGAATFKGTRILVHQVADLVSQGATEVELREDYPRLTREMIAAAAIYAKSHPRQGRPRKPSWRNNQPLSTRTIERRGA